MDAVAVLLRRWYVLGVGALFLAAGAWAVFTYVPTTYQASGQMIFLLPPSASGTDKPINPYLNMQSGLTTAASIVSGAAATKDVQRALAEDGFDAEYAVAVIPGTGPLMTITSKAKDPAEAVATRNAVMAWIDGEVGQIQADVDVPRDQFIQATRSSVSSGAEVLPGSKLRALVGVGVLVGILTLVATFLLDRLLTKRTAKREAASDDDGDDADQGVAAAPVPLKSVHTPVDEPEVLVKRSMLPRRTSPGA
ncbi:MAG: hypothetical protein ABWZ91_02465 [Nocardioides sp.]